MTMEIAKELKRYGIVVNSVAPSGMWTPGCLSNDPVKSLSPEKQAKIGKEMIVARLDATPPPTALPWSSTLCVPAWPMAPPAKPW